MANPQQPPQQPPARTAPVGDPGSIFDHVFRLAAALRAQQWAEALTLVVDIFGKLNDPMQARGGAGMAAAGDHNALAGQLEALAGRHGGQPGAGRQAPATVDWGQFLKTLVPLLIQALMTIFGQQPAPTPVVPPVQTG